MCHRQKTDKMANSVLAELTWCVGMAEKRTPHFLISSLGALRICEILRIANADTKAFRITAFGSELKVTNPKVHNYDIIQSVSRIIVTFQAYCLTSRFVVIERHNNRAKFICKYNKKTHPFRCVFPCVLQFCARQSCIYCNVGMSLRRAIVENESNLELDALII